MANSTEVSPTAALSTRAVFARHAASVLVLRHRAAGPEVLMGVRRSGHRFMPNRLVFPGGAVDPADADSPAATELRPEVAAMLERSARPRLARAIATAVARELLEETGSSLGNPPSLHRLDYLCRAVTPPESPIRFNARFLIASIDDIEGTPVDSRELQDVRYVPLAALHMEDLVLVTREVVQRLQLWLALTEAERMNRTDLHVFKRRRWGLE